MSRCRAGALPGQICPGGAPVPQAARGGVAAERGGSHLAPGIVMGPREGLIAQGDVLDPPGQHAPSCRPRVARRAILRGMSLTLGPAPLGNKPAGVFNREPEREGLLYLEPSPRRIRGIAGGVTVIDSREARTLHEYGRLPIYLFPCEEGRTDLLEPSDERTATDA